MESMTTNQPANTPKKRFTIQQNVPEIRSKFFSHRIIDNREFRIRTNSSDRSSALNRGQGAIDLDTDRVAPDLDLALKSGIKRLMANHGIKEFPILDMFDLVKEHIDRVGIRRASDKEQTLRKIRSLIDQM